MIILYINNKKGVLDMWTYIWLAAVVVSLIIEFVSLELVSIWVSVGSFLAMILALCGVGFEIQIIVAVVVSIGCILGLRKITLKLLYKNKDKTNLDLAIGTKVKLIESVTPDKMGVAKYNGLDWSVKSKDESLTIKEGSHVEILSIEGNKLIVRPLQEENVKEEEPQEEKKVFLAKTSSKKTKAVSNKPKTKTVSVKSKSTTKKTTKTKKEEK